MLRQVVAAIMRCCYSNFPVFHCTHSNGICHRGFAVCTVKNPDDGQRKCPKHIEFYSKNKFKKFLHLVGFIIRMG